MKKQHEENTIQRITIILISLCVLSGISGVIIISVFNSLGGFSAFGISLLLACILGCILWVSIQGFVQNFRIQEATKLNFWGSLEYIANTLPYRIILLDSNDYYKTSIKNTCLPHSYEPKSAKDKPLYQVLDKDLADIIQQASQKALREDSTQFIEYTHWGKHKLHYYEAYIVPFVIPQTQEVQILWIARDITEQKEQEQRLINDEKRVRSIISALPDRTVILNDEGWYYDTLKLNYDIVSIPFVNNIARGQHLSEFFDAEFVEYCMQKIHETIEKDALQVFEYHIEREGQTSEIEGRTIPYTDIITGEKQVIWISRDITERKKNQQALLDSQKLLYTIIGVFPDRTLIFNRDGQYQEILKVQYDEASEINLEKVQIQVGKYIHDYFPKEFSDFCLEMIRKTIDSGKVQVFEYQTPLEDTEHQIEGRTIPFRDPKTGELRVLWIGRDISHLKQAEQQRLDLIVEKEKLGFFKEFVSNLTHDLKTPLSVIETSLAVLERLQDPEKQKKKYSVAHNQVKILNEMIDDMLMAARIDNIPEFELSTVELVDLLRAILNDVRPKADYKAQSIIFNTRVASVIVKANQNELRRAITNILDNAIKYTPEEGQIEITLDLNNFEVTIQIQDEGIGIKQEALPHIFERFYRSDDGRFAAHGTGLGLTIAHHIIRLHDGKIDVKSEVGQGSAFYIRLPVYKPS